MINSNCHKTIPSIIYRKRAQTVFNSLCLCKIPFPRRILPISVLLFLCHMLCYCVCFGLLLHSVRCDRSFFLSRTETYSPRNTYLTMSHRLKNLTVIILSEDCTRCTTHAMRMHITNSNAMQ